MHLISKCLALFSIAAFSGCGNSSNFPKSESESSIDSANSNGPSHEENENTAEAAEQLDDGVLTVNGVGIAVRPLVSKGPDEWGPRLPIYRYQGKAYLQAQEGAEFGLEFIVDTNKRYLFVSSVDGTSIWTGKPATTDDGGYIMTRGTSIDDNMIPGWRDGSERVHRFVFSSRADAYAAKVGRPENVGVIGLAVFEEKPRPPMSAGGAPAGAAGGAPAGAAGRAPTDLGTGYGESAENRVTLVKFERGRKVAQFALYYASGKKLREAGIITRTTRPLGETDAFPGDSGVPSVPAPPGYREN